MNDVLSVVLLISLFLTSLSGFLSSFLYNKQKERTETCLNNLELLRRAVNSQQMQILLICGALDIRMPKDSTKPGVN